MSLFQKAERKQAKLKIALSGPSGSGKTFSALSMARGIGKKIAVIDTENGSASLYADRFEFDTLQLRPPYSPAKYIEAVQAAVAAGYDVLVIDSLSQVWAGEGGVLDKKSALDARGGNQYANWKQPKGEHQKFKDAVLHSPVHTIVTIRSKQGYQIDEESKKVRKVGLDPIAEPGLEYEYTVVLDIDMGHNAVASKDRTSLFDGEIFKIGAGTGEKIMAWLNAAKVDAAPAMNPAWDNVANPPVQPKAQRQAPQASMQASNPAFTDPSKGVTEKQVSRLYGIAHSEGITEAEVKTALHTRYGITSASELNRAQYQEFCDAMEHGQVAS